MLGVACAGGGGEVGESYKKERWSESVLLPAHDSEKTDDAEWRNGLPPCITSIITEQTCLLLCSAFFPCVCLFA